MCAVSRDVPEPSSIRPCNWRYSPPHPPDDSGSRAIELNGRTVLVEHHHRVDVVNVPSGQITLQLHGLDLMLQHPTLTFVAAPGQSYFVSVTGTVGFIQDIDGYLELEDEAWINRKVLLISIT
jgi:hypothetical protein